jgi:hypothetical protein
MQNSLHYKDLRSVPLPSPHQATYHRKQLLALKTTVCPYARGKGPNKKGPGIVSAGTNKSPSTENG